VSATADWEKAAAGIAVMCAVVAYGMPVWLGLILLLAFLVVR
jgi:hypothetical protein